MHLSSFCYIYIHFAHYPRQPITQGNFDCNSFVLLFDFHLLAITSSTIPPLYIFKLLALSSSPYLLLSPFGFISYPPPPPPPLFPLASISSLVPPYSFDSYFSNFLSILNLYWPSSFLPISLYKYIFDSILNSIISLLPSSLLFYSLYPFVSNFSLSSSLSCGFHFFFLFFLLYEVQENSGGRAPGLQNRGTAFLSYPEQSCGVGFTVCGGCNDIALSHCLWIYE